MNQNVTLTLDAVRELTINRLANEAGSLAPDREDSPGARFLDRVRDSVIESLEWKVENDDQALGTAARVLRGDSHELADGAVPVYTYDRWLTFTDLGAWQVDIDEYVGGGEDMTTLAGVALYEVARMLTDALCDFVETYWSELVEEGDITDDEQDDDTDAELDSGSGE